MRVLKGDQLLRIKNIRSTETQDKLKKLGFQFIEKNTDPLTRTGLPGEESNIFAWFNGHKRIRRQTPTIVIAEDDGLIDFHMTTVFIRRTIPSILLILFEEGMVEKV